MPSNKVGKELVLRGRRPKRRKMAVHREARCWRRRANEGWNLEFVHDPLGKGPKFRTLTVVDILSREELAIEVGQRVRGEHVVMVLNRLVRRRNPFADNGAEFTGNRVDFWAYYHGVRIDFSRPVRPTDNAFIGTFNGSLRDECLSLHWFDTLAEAEALIQARRRDYNESRPHIAPCNKRLGNILWLQELSPSTGLTGVEANPQSRITKPENFNLAINCDELNHGLEPVILSWRLLLRCLVICTGRLLPTGGLHLFKYKY